MHWRDSLDAKPDGRTTPALFQEQAATPSAPGDLTGTADGALRSAVIVCRLSSTVPREKVGPTPDLLVELTLADRETVLGYLDRTTWAFSIGLVDLAIGDPVSIRVSEDTLHGGRPLLDGSEDFNGSGRWGWTHRVEDRRTTLRCGVAEANQVEQAVKKRLAKAWRAVRQGNGDVEIIRLAALVGWSDPRVVHLQGWNHSDQQREERVSVPSD